MDIPLPLNNISINNLFMEIFNIERRWEEFVAISRNIVYTFIIPHSLHFANIIAMEKLWQEFCVEIEKMKEIDEKKNKAIKFLNFLKEWIKFDVYEKGQRFLMQQRLIHLDKDEGKVDLVYS